MHDTIRTAVVNRKTSETEISCSLNIDGRGRADVQTGIGFLDHMLNSLTRHSGFDLMLSCTGDLQVDDHHSAEDCALALGEAFDRALKDKRGIARFGWALVPMDEALARVSVDLSGRPYAVVNLDLLRETLGDIACENLVHVFESFATAARINLHVDVIRGGNDHHKAEAAFKALAQALKQAVAIEGDAIPSTKGSL